MRQTGLTSTLLKCLKTYTRHLDPEAWLTTTTQPFACELVPWHLDTPTEVQVTLNHSHMAVEHGNFVEIVQRFSAHVTSGPCPDYSQKNLHDVVFGCTVKAKLLDVVGS